MIIQLRREFEIGTEGIGSSDVAKELREMRFGLEVNPNDDDEGDEAVVSNDLGLLHCPSAPLHEYSCPSDRLLSLAYYFMPQIWGAQKWEQSWVQ